MNSKIAPPSLAIVTLTFLLIVGSFAMIPQSLFIAQSCNAGEQVHVVSSGENLFRIGLRYGVSYTTLASRNGINDVTRIFAGQTICIPVGATVNTTTTTQIITQVIVVTATPSASTTTTTTTTVASGQENWCYDGQPWGDGRCLHPGNSTLQDDWFYRGWCNAQVRLGNYTGTLEECFNGAPLAGASTTDSTTSSVSTVVTTYNFDLVDDDGEFACTIVFDKDTGLVTALAKWDDPYDDQTQIIFFTNLPNFSNQFVDLGEDTEQAGIAAYSIPHKTFSMASARIKGRVEADDPSFNEAVAECERIET